MAKVKAIVGYIDVLETAPGVWSDEQPIERVYYGDLTRNSRRWQSADSTNKDIVLNNTLSILGDSYANSHLSSIIYVILNGTKWTVTNIEIMRPRLIITIGGVYNG